MKYIILSYVILSGVLLSPSLSIAQEPESVQNRRNENFQARTAEKNEKIQERKQAISAKVGSITEARKFAVLGRYEAVYLRLLNINNRLGGKLAQVTERSDSLASAQGLLVKNAELLQAVASQLAQIKEATYSTDSTIRPALQELRSQLKETRSVLGEVRNNQIQILKFLKDTRKN